MNALEPLFARLARSTFRSRFRLGIKEKQYCWDKGAEVIDCSGSQKARMRSKKDATPCCVAF